MLRSPTKSASDVDISRRDTTPPPTLFVSSRQKRRHESITRDDFDEFRAEIRQMFLSFQEKMTSAFANIEKSMEFLSQQHDEFNNKIKKLQEECQRNYNHVVVLQEKVEELQRTSKLNYIELRNVPYKDKESKLDLLNYIQNITTSLNMSIHQTDILDIYRLPGRKDTNRPIIAQLSHVKIKASLISAVKNFNKSNANGKLNMSHAGEKGNTCPIYLTEHLTANSRRLFYLARQLKTKNKLKFCWVSDGKVLVKETDNGQAIYIKTESQLQALVAEK